MWEFAENHPGWFFLYILVVSVCSLTAFLFLMLLISSAEIKVRREDATPKKCNSRPNANKVLKPEGETTNNARSTRH